VAALFTVAQIATGGQPLLPAALLPRVATIASMQTFALAIVVPLIVGAGVLVPFLRSGRFEELLVTDYSRGEITRTLWGLLWVRSAFWAGVVMGVNLVGFMVMLPLEAWRDLVRVHALQAIVAQAPLAVAASLVVKIAMRRRTLGALAVEGLPRLIVLYPLLFGYALILFLFALMIFLAPLVSLGGALLPQVMPGAWVAGAAGWLIGLGVVCYVIFLCSVLIRVNLGEAERWCVPSDWLERWLIDHAASLPESAT
jgi:hypothetical protein